MIPPPHGYGIEKVLLAVARWSTLPYANTYFVASWRVHRL